MFPFPTFFTSPYQFAIAFLVMTVAEAVYVSFGFGAGLIAVGTLAMVLPELADVVVLLLLVSLPVEALVIFGARRTVDWRGISLIAGGLFLGTPIGTRLLTSGDSGFLLQLLGGFLILVGVVFVGLPTGFRVRWPRGAAPAFGFLAGILAGLFGTGGPPLIVYFRLAGVDKATFRTSLIGVFLLLTVVRFPNYYLEGLLTAPRIGGSLALLPAVALGAYLGNRVQLRMTEITFQRLVSVLLAVLGVVLLRRSS